ncbi:sugar transferase [Nodosilinea sp. P-1105]|uniref:sugar transferase n=1 Tax=Nodosilinea sp. P-1105 TaxID=2546229 RepID=UPI00146F3B9A|nr:sugar transferase [Nodosilinea sp. P-1105]NMF82642.1 sugar transferase [Nodosilinea sp. P-1105]
MQDSAKRLFDIVSSSVALVILAIPLLLIALWIRLDSPGPILFRQTRIGRHGRPFSIVKFRSMRHRNPQGIDQHAEPVVTTGHDPRITRAGRLLRATSLDELPQLWNILVGEMSVVGPRPVLPEQVEVVPDHLRQRFQVRPGLTGLAQVRGRRSLSWLDQLAADQEYVARHSLVMDLGLIVRTIGVLFTGSGVYGGEAQNWRAYRDTLKRSARPVSSSTKPSNHGPS